MGLDSAVKVNITRETKFPTQPGFGIPAILSNEADALLTDRVTTFNIDSALDELLDAGFSTGDETYKAVSALAAQSPRVEKVKVIKQADSIAAVKRITISTVANNFTYEVTLNGVLYQFTSDGSATDLEIQAGLIALINPLPEVAAVALSTNQITVTSSFPGQDFSLSVGTNLTAAVITANLGPVEELADAREEDDDWYFLLDTTHTPLQVKLIAAYMETQVKMYAYQTDDADSRGVVVGSDTTSLMAVLKAAGYDRTFGIWVPTADLSEYKMAAIVGVMAPKDPGSASWKFKSANGISAVQFTSQQLSNVEAKNGNVYITLAQQDIFEQGVVASGEFIDIMVGTDWLAADIQFGVFNLFTSEEKVPYDDGGIEAIVLQVETSLDKAVNRRILVGGEDGPKVTAPKRSATSLVDRAARFLRDVKFTGFYSGAVHKVQIDGTLSV